MSQLKRSPSQSVIETTPLVGVILGLILGTIPVMPRVATWVVPLFFAACIARLYTNRPHSRLPSLPVKVILFAMGIGGVGLTYGSMLGIDPGLSILVVLVSLKLIEANGERDFHVLVLLGYFLSLCDLFFSQDLTVWIYVAFTTILLTATLVRFHRGPGKASYRYSTRLALTLFLQTLPAVIILFLFFPRIYGGFRFQFSQSLLGTSGMSERLSPGVISSLALTDQTAFRVDFPDGNMPPTSAMYWRACVLWRGDGLNWVVGPHLTLERRIGHQTGPAIRQRISVVPHGARWLFALDRPSSEVKGATYQPGGFIQSRRPINSQYRYEVTSRPDNLETVMPRDQMAEASRLPANIPPRVRALVESWKKEHSEPKELVMAAYQYFARERFVYTLSPGGYQDSTGLEDFLFERRQGFCEHYAAAFATLMRVAGVPSRVVIGYHGGEYNSMGQYVIVRQSEAHAWCEVWLKDVGWYRVDPTDAIAPERISAGLASYLETRAQTDPSGMQRSLTSMGWREFQREIQRNMRLFWDSINYQWDLRILNYDEDSQQGFLFSLGLRNASWPELAIWILVAIAVFLAILALWLRRPRHRKRDEILLAYGRFCRALERAGLRRESWEGPQQFGERAAAHFTEQSALIRNVTDLYIRLRYGAQEASSDELVRVVRRLPKFAAPPTKA